MNKEYKVKIKMVQEQWLKLKMRFLLLFCGGDEPMVKGIKISKGESTEGHFSWWGDEQIFGL